MIRLLELQTEMLREIAMGRDLSSFAELLCRSAEQLASDVICSIMTLDGDGRLHLLAGPSLPDSYRTLLHAIPCGPKAGSCGTAAFHGREVVVTDIESDPLWEVARGLALPFGLRACWSSPIIGDNGRVLATFAFYYRTSHRGPGEMERRIVETCVDLCAIAIRHHDAQTRVERLAFIDALTGLPNRAAFEEFAERALMSEAHPVAIHYIDVDEFKLINDTLGHRAGDLLLNEIGRRLKAVVSDDVFLARLGGDEFVLYLRGNDPATQARLARTVLEALIPPVEIMEHSFVVTASIGIALGRSQDGYLEELSRNADIALYRAKAEGRNTYRLFSDDMAGETQERQKLKADLRWAIDHDELHLVYQPIMDMQTRSLSSFEALLRWTHPERGPIGPDRFIPLAEESGLIGKIGLWVLRRAAQDALAWPAEIALAVNISPLQLKQPGFVLEVARALRDSGLPPTRLVLEMTETALFDNDALTRQALTELKALGATIALDDFGTGYSSLSLIRDRRFRQLKIDKSFVDGIGSCRDSEVIVRGTINIARQMGFRIVAEGIEYASQLAWLEANGCDEVQGYLISRPMPEKDIAGFILAQTHLSTRLNAAGRT